MSGTSLDGIDAVCCDFSATKIKTLGHLFKTFPEDLKILIKKLINHSLWDREEFIQADIKLGNIYAEIVLELLKKLNLKPSQIGAIGSHGQTIFHQPNGLYRSSIQIGDPNIISARTAIKTISDFRRRDMAEGGQGAPLVPLFHEYVFKEKNKIKIILNLGGIANITVLIPDQPVLGYDTGPANILIDSYCQLRNLGDFDAGGVLASQGKVDLEILNFLLEDPYFLMSGPKSSGREKFNLSWLEQKLLALGINLKDLKDQDVLALLTELTARSIAKEVQGHTDFVSPLVGVTPAEAGAQFNKMKLRGREGVLDQELIICGGGARNDFLVSRLRFLLPDWDVLTTEFLSQSLGLDLNSSWIEAQAFAYFAMRTCLNLPSNMPSVTGASRPVVLGVISHG